MAARCNHGLERKMKSRHLKTDERERKKRNDEIEREWGKRREWKLEVFI